MGCHPVAIHIYTQTIHSTKELTTEQPKKMVGCGPCPVFASFTLAFALQLRKKHGKTSVRVRKTSVTLRKTSVTVQRPQSQYKNLSHSTVYILPKRPTHYKALTSTQIRKPTHTHTTKQYITTTVQIKTKCL